MRFSLVRYLASLSTICLLYWACTWTGSTLDASKLKLFIDMPSLLIVFGVSLAVLMARHGQDAWQRLLPAMFLSPCTRRQQADEELAKLIKTAITAIWLSGGFGLLVGLILLLANLNDPSKIGGGLAVAIICPLYTCLLHLWLFTAIGWAQEHGESSDETAPVTPMRRAGYMLLTPFSAIMILSILGSYDPNEGGNVQSIHSMHSGAAVPDDEFDFGVIEANLAGSEMKKSIRVNVIFRISPYQSYFTNSVLGKKGWEGGSRDCSHLIRSRLQEEMSTWTASTIAAPERRKDLAEKLLKITREVIDGQPEYAQIQIKKVYFSNFIGF